MTCWQDVSKLTYGEDKAKDECYDLLQSQIQDKERQCMTPEWVTASSTGILAFLTFAAVLVAIYRDLFRDLIYCPTLEVQFTAGYPDCHSVPLKWRGDSAKTHYVRLRIHNSGRVAAKEVEVAVTAVRRRSLAGDYLTMNMGVPWNLVWAHYGTHVIPQIPVGAERHIDLGHVVDPAKRHLIPTEDDPNRNLRPEDTLFCLAFFVRSNSLEYLLDEGEYEIDMQIAAANAKPKDFAFYLNHKGAWLDDDRRMYTECLGLRVLG